MGLVVWSGLGERRREPELMDDPGLDPSLHDDAMRALARINRVSLTDHRVWQEVLRLAPTTPGPVRVLDVACGDGEVLVRVAARARARRIDLRVHGLDVNEKAVERARAHAERSGVEARFQCVDVTRTPLPHGFTLVTSSLFLHHLDDREVVRLLAGMAASGRALLVQDLRRTLRGYALAWAGLHGITRSPVARIDGLISVRASYTLSEMRDLCARAGLTGARVDACWPQRMTVRWERSER